MDLQIRQRHTQVLASTQAFLTQILSRSCEEKSGVEEKSGGNAVEKNGGVTPDFSPQL